MSKLCLVLAVVLLPVASFAGEPPVAAVASPAPAAAAQPSQSASPAASGPAPQTDRERISYALGVDIIAKLRRSGLVVDGEALARGVQDAAANRKLAMSDEEIRKAVAQEQGKLRVRSRFGGTEHAPGRPPGAPSAPPSTGPTDKK